MSAACAAQQEASPTGNVPPGAAVDASVPETGATVPETGAPATNGTLVETKEATSLRRNAFSANGRIQPRGRPATYAYEYGATTAYGAKTPMAKLPPRLAAYYHESWDSAGGWLGGMAGESLAHVPSGGVSGGHVRYQLPNDIDVNHVDGIGPNQLVQYMYPSIYDGAEYAAWSAGEADLRGARASAYVRGNAFVQRGSELVFWLQSTPNESTKYEPACPDFTLTPCTEKARWSNWAFTGSNLTAGLMSGKWEKVEYRLVNDTTQWSYAGHYVDANRADYVYQPLDSMLSHANGDIFHMLVFFDVTSEPGGSIDFDEYEIVYRNRSVLLRSNGGRLASSPTSADDPARLTDGWRNGAGKTWRSALAPQAPLEITYDFARPIVIDAVQIHQNPEWPSKDVEVSFSTDGVVYKPLVKGIVPETANAGPNYAFLLQTGLRATASHVKVRILSGYKADYWGLGEIEVFGSGAVMETDDDWYDVTTDITGLKPGSTYHYRLIAQTDAGTTYGTDRTFTVPATTKPEVVTAAASRIGASSAKVEGRVNPMGVRSSYYFEYGVDHSYGAMTTDENGYLRDAGLEVTPRTVTAQLTDLLPGTRYHYRLVAANETGTTYGADASFVAK